MGLLLHKWFIFPAMLLIGSFQQPSPGSVTVNSFHPFYISVTEVHHNATSKSLEISCKMFADDFEATLEKNYKATLDITTEKDQGSFNKFIPDYINKHLSISVDGKPVSLSYVGFEHDKGSAYCYFEILNVPDVKKIDFTNSLLFDFTNEQMNIMHVTVNGNRKSSRLNYPDKTSSISF